VIGSAVGQEAKVIEALRLGARDFVVEPFDAEWLLWAVEKALA
jgi:two-component system, chemotaxis family, chemotaxis protein CheY